MAADPVTQAGQATAARYGVMVTGGAKTLPHSTVGSIFTVSGGRIMITSLIGVVSTVIQNQACTLSIDNTPTGQSSQTASLAAAEAITAAAVGTFVSMAPLSGGAAANLVVGAMAVAIPEPAGGIAIVPAGAITVTTSATNTGAITWSITYFPYDAGATVVAL